jgi:uncharacterized membrane protein YedE/YeeE
VIVDFTPFPALVGGAMIGLSASLLLASHGRIAGISGIWGGLLRRFVIRQPGDLEWRMQFMAGLLVGAVLVALLAPQAIQAPLAKPLPLVAVAGLLVGVGTRLGNGCTSGHGVCGLSRLSPRSAVAVVTFMALGFGVATGVGALLGGG